MKILMLVISLFFCISASAETTAEYLCMETGHTSGFIMAEVTENDTDTRVIVSQLNIDGVVLGTQTYTSADDDLHVNKSVDQDGDDFIVITSLIGGEEASNMRVLVCASL